MKGFYMAKVKRKDAWRSPTKQREFEEKRRQLRNKRLIKLTCIILAIAILVAVIVFVVKLLTRPYYADIEVQYVVDGKVKTGVITILLRDEYAPVTVKNFVKLAKDGFYDGTTFDKIIEGNMMQGGGAKDENSAKALTPIIGEFIENGRNQNTLLHQRGVVSMARDSASDYDSATSKFFIIQYDQPSYDGKYAAFGVVYEGMDIVDEICNNAKASDNKGTIPQDAQPKILSVTIKRTHK